MGPKIQRFPVLAPAVAWWQQAGARPKGPPLTVTDACSPHLIAFADRPRQRLSSYWSRRQCNWFKVGRYCPNYDTLLGKLGQAGVGHGTGSLVSQPRRPAGHFSKSLSWRSFVALR